MPPEFYVQIRHHGHHAPPQIPSIFAISSTREKWSPPRALSATGQQPRDGGSKHDQKQTPHLRHATPLSTSPGNKCHSYNLIKGCVCVTDPHQKSSKPSHPKHSVSRLNTEVSHNPPAARHQTAPPPRLNWPRTAPPRRKGKHGGANILRLSESGSWAGPRGRGPGGRVVATLFPLSRLFSLVSTSLRRVEITESGYS